MSILASSLASPQVGAAGNMGRRGPLQGFDSTVYFLDEATGNLIATGEFTAFQFAVRNATEVHLPLGSRHLTLLDGEFQIGWVAEQAKINIEAQVHYMGYEFLGSLVEVGRSPRFTIVVQYNASELDETNGVPGYVHNQFIGDRVLPAQGAQGAPKRATVGQTVLRGCKIDDMTTAIQAGRTAIADRIVGLASTWYYQKIDPNSDSLIQKVTLAPAQTNRDVNRYFDSVNLNYSSASSVPTWAQGNRNNSGVPTQS